MSELKILSEDFRERKAREAEEKEKSEKEKLFELLNGATKESAIAAARMFLNESE